MVMISPLRGDIDAGAFARRRPMGRRPCPVPRLSRRCGQAGSRPGHQADRCRPKLGPRPDPEVAEAPSFGELSESVRLRLSGASPALSRARCRLVWSASSARSVSGRSTATCTAELPSAARSIRTTTWPSSAGSSRTVTAVPAGACATCTSTGATCRVALAGPAGVAAATAGSASRGAAGTAGAAQWLVPLLPA